MFDLTRRNALKLMGSAAALVAVPFHKAAALIHRSLHEDVQRTVSRWTPAVLDRELEGVYSKIFARKKSTMQVEQVAHVKYLSLAQMNKFRNAVNVSDGSPFDNGMSPRFIYNFSTYEVGLAFAVVEDDDPRAGVVGSDREPSIVGIVHVRQGEPTTPLAPPRCAAGAQDHGSHVSRYARGKRGRSVQRSTHL